MSRLLKYFTEERLAQECGVSQPAISAWLRGARRPNYQSRKVLLKRFSIDMDAWDEPATEIMEGT